MGIFRLVLWLLAAVAVAVVAEAMVLRSLGAMRHWWLQRQRWRQDKGEQ